MSPHQSRRRPPGGRQHRPRSRGTGRITDAFLAWQKFSQDEDFPVGAIISADVDRSFPSRSSPPTTPLLPDETPGKQARIFLRRWSRPTTIPAARRRQPGRAVPEMSGAVFQRQRPDHRWGAKPRSRVIPAARGRSHITVRGRRPLAGVTVAPTLAIIADFIDDPTPGACQGRWRFRLSIGVRSVDGSGMDQPHRISTAIHRDRPRGRGPSQRSPLGSRASGDRRTTPGS